MLYNGISPILCIYQYDKLYFFECTFDLSSGYLLILYTVGGGALKHVSIVRRHVSDWSLFHWVSTVQTKPPPVKEMFVITIQRICFITIWIVCKILNMELLWIFVCLSSKYYQNLEKYHDEQSDALYITSEMELSFIL